MRDGEVHPAGLGRPEEPRHLLNSGVPSQQVGELMQSACGVGREGALSKTKQEEETGRY